MKKVILLLLVKSLFITKIFAQNLTVADLIKLTECRNFPCFSDYVDNKGFSYERVDTNAASTCYYFASEENFVTSNGKTTRNVSSIVLPANSKYFYVSVGFNTADKPYYMQLLDSFKAKGFEPATTTNLNQRVTTQYSSVKYKDLSLTVTIGRMYMSGIAWTSYGFQLMRNAHATAGM